MNILQRYFSSEIILAVLFVLAAFLSLFTFFDIMGELPAVGHGGYQLHHAFVYVFLKLPGYIYELMPIAVLIGTIYVLAKLASQSEITIMRVSGLSPWMAAALLLKIGIGFIAITFVLGEYVAPTTTQFAEKWKLRTQGSALSQEFQSGLWARDTIRINPDNESTGSPTGSRFWNAQELLPSGQLINVRLYELDHDFHLTSWMTAHKADYLGDHRWHLTEGTETRFMEQETVRHPFMERTITSELTPDILSVLLVDPDRMSSLALSAYTRHLAENKQRTERYEIALWKKIITPFAILVMMALALPFAYLHFRSGGVSLKIFIGIMIGVSFQLINSLFSHLGLLNAWPPLFTVLFPSVLFLLVATIALWWVERR